jgi:hypothetical protein
MILAWQRPAKAVLPHLDGSDVCSGHTEKRSKAGSGIAGSLDVSETAFVSVSSASVRTQTHIRRTEVPVVWTVDELTKPPHQAFRCVNLRAFSTT